MDLPIEGVALYRMPEFVENTDTENLFGDGISLDHLNDDAVGRGRLVRLLPRPHERSGITGMVVVEEG